MCKFAIGQFWRKCWVLCKYRWAAYQIGKIFNQSYGRFKASRFMCHLNTDNFADNVLWGLELPKDNKVVIHVGYWRQFHLKKFQLLHCTNGKTNKPKTKQKQNKKWNERQIQKPKRIGVCVLFSGGSCIYYIIFSLQTMASVFFFFFLINWFL